MMPRTYRADPQRDPDDQIGSVWLPVHGLGRTSRGLSGTGSGCWPFPPHERVRSGNARGRSGPTRNAQRAASGLLNRDRSRTNHRWGSLLDLWISLNGQEKRGIWSVVHRRRQGCPSLLNVRHNVQDRRNPGATTPSTSPSEPVTRNVPLRVRYRTL